MAPSIAHLYASEYLAAGSGASDFLQWLILLGGAAGTGAYFGLRDRPDVTARLMRSFGIKGRKQQGDDDDDQKTPEEKVEQAPDYVARTEMEALVDAKVAAALAAAAHTTPPVPPVPPASPQVSIPRQRDQEQVPPPVTFTKPAEAVQEALSVEEPEEEIPAPEEPAKPAEPVQKPVTAPQPPVAEKPEEKKPEPVRERLVVPEVRKAAPAPTPTTAPHITREDEPLEATGEEKELLDKLQPEVWQKIAPTRNLGKTVIESAVLTRAGIKVLIKLDGDWTLPKFQAREESVRMLLEVRKDVMSRITEADKSGWVILSLRTRSACPTFIPWYPGAPLGFCTVTGKEIRVDFRRHLAIAGASDTGKSVTARNIFADVCFDAVAALIYCDPKRVEGALWRGRARVALDPDEIHEVALELDAENTRRKIIMEQRGWDKWIPSEEDPTLIVPVDEGASLVADAKDPSLEKEEKVLRKQTLGIFTKGAREWRSQGIHIIWMTQYPTVEEGMPQQIGANIPDRISMALGMERHAEVVFDKENVANGWKSHKLPRSPKGLALVKVGIDCEPNPVQIVYLDKSRISELPLSGIWYPSGVRYAKVVTDEPAEAETSAPQAVAVNEQATTLITPQGETVVVDTPSDEEPLSAEEKVQFAFTESEKEAMTFGELIEATQIHRATLFRLLTKMLKDGTVAKGGHNEWKLA